MAVAATPEETTLNIDDIKQTVKATEASSRLDPESRTQIIELYQKTISNLEAAIADRAQSRQFVEGLETAPDRIAAIRKDLDTPVPTTESAIDGKLATLEQRLLDKQTELLRLRAELADTSALATDEKELNLSDLLATALQQQSTAQADLATSLKADDNDTAELHKARRAFRLSKLEGINARVGMLRKQQLSRDARLEYLDLKQRLLTRQTNAASDLAGRLQTAVNIARQNEAGDIALKARQRADKLENASAVVRALAEDNSALATDMAAVSRRTESLLGQRESLRKERDRLDRYYTSLTQQLAVAGADRLALLGIELQNQRYQLTQRQLLTVEPQSLNQELARAQLNKLRLEDRQYAEAPVSGTEASALEREFFEEQANLLQDNVKTYRRYIDALTATRSENDALQLKIKEYWGLLNSRLFWIPSAAAVSLQSLWGLGTEIEWLLKESQWQQAISIASQPWRSAYWLVGILFLIAVLLLGLQPYLRMKLKQQARNIGKVNRIRFPLTLLALVISLLLALPGPLIFGALAMLIHQGEAFALQFRTGLLNAAGLWFLLNSFRQVCRSGGLAESHFQWPTDILLLIRKNLSWLIWVLLPITLLMPMAANIEEQYDAFSRLLFAIASVALAYAAHRVLRPQISLTFIASDNARWHWLIRYVFYPLAVFLPLLLLGFSWYGYHFTALEIESKLFTTACLLAVLLVLYYLGLRAITVLERRMTLDRLRAKRKLEKARHANRQAADEAAQGIPELVKSTVEDMNVIHKQSRLFLSMLVGLIAAFLLWTLWSDLLPAVGILNDIELWEISPSEPHLPAYSVTLADVFIAIVLIFLTYFGARNIPGALEISVLRNLSLDPGTSYATTTIVRYIIIFIGLIIVLNILGAQWSKLQWLIAAMGVGLGFGLQEIVANFISGLLILFERPIRVGDTITVGEHTGTVSQIRIRATVLTDWNRKEQIIPNKTFITEQLTNWTLSDPITRQVIKVGVAYGSDVALVHEILSTAIAGNNKVISDPPSAVFFVGFGDSSLDFEIRVFVESMLDIMPLIHELHVELEARLREQGIEIPFPQRDIWIRSEPGQAPVGD